MPNTLTTIFIRTLFFFVLLVVAMRIMGKRQIGELEVSELVTTLLLSEIASLPITNYEIPILHAVIPIFTILFIEVLMSVISTKVPALKNLVSSRPSVLINKGTIDQRELSRVRISLDELISELRQKDVSDISEVDYAILEQNGKITVILKSMFRQPNAKQLGLKPQESGIIHILISDGKINKHTLQLSPFNKQQLNALLSKKGLEAKDVFLMTVDDLGKTNIIKKETT